MMKHNFILTIILICSIQQIFSQSKLTDYGVRAIKMDSVKKITEWKINYDSIGEAIDTTLEFELFYDIKGDLVEERCQFNIDHTRYSAAFYTYDSNHVQIGVKYVPPSRIFSWDYERYSIRTNCSTFNISRQVVNTTLLYSNGDMEYWTFEYEGRLLKCKKIYINGHLTVAHKIDYGHF